jgi:hypothetical protein
LVADRGGLNEEEEINQKPNSGKIGPASTISLLTRRNAVNRKLYGVFSGSKFLIGGHSNQTLLTLQLAEVRILIPGFLAQCII